MYRAYSRLSSNHMIKLYNALILPYIFYCNYIWSSGNKTDIDQLVKVQNRAVRCISHVSKNISPGPFYKTYSILTIREILFYSIACFMYKLYHDMHPLYYKELFTTNVTVHNHFTRQSDLLHPPLCRTELSKRFITYRGVIVWNKLCKNKEIKRYISAKLQTFKYHLKLYMSTNTHELDM